MAVIYNGHWNGVRPTPKLEALIKSLSFCLHSNLQWWHNPVVETKEVTINNEGNVTQISVHIIFLSNTSRHHRLLQSFLLRSLPAKKC